MHINLYHFRRYCLLVTFCIYACYTKVHGSPGIMPQGANVVDSVACISTRDAAPKISAGTNLLLDALALPNLSLQVPVSKHFSVGASAVYGWWKHGRSHKFWRFCGADANINYWLDQHRGPLTGHRIGIMSSLYAYDLEWKGKGSMSGTSDGDRFIFASGLTYGYAFPLSTVLRLDLSITLGYSGGDYREYEHREGHHVWLTNRRRHYWGPVRAGVSLNWNLGSRKSGKDGTP